MLLFVACIYLLCGAHGQQTTVEVDVITTQPVNTVQSYYIGATSQPPWGDLRHAADVARHIPLARLWGISATMETLESNLTFWAQANTKVLLDVAPTQNAAKNNVTFHLDVLRDQLTEVVLKKEIPLFAIEMGNEPNCYGGKGASAGAWWEANGMKLMATVYRDTRKILDEVFKDRPDLKPLLTGASWSFAGDTEGLCGSKQTLTQNLDFVEQFMQLAGDTLDVFTWHYYPACGGCTACPNEPKPDVNLFLQGIQQQPGWGQGMPYLDLIRYITPKILAIKHKYSRNAALWNTETATLWNGGLNNASNAFASGFYWIDQLGYWAQNEHDAVTRQILWQRESWSITDCSGYQLVDLHRNKPATARTDFLTKELWNLLMGRSVLHTTTNNNEVHVFAHCTPGDPDGLSLAFLNTNNSNRAALQLSSHIVTIPRIEYILTAHNLQSLTMLVNGIEWTDFDSLPHPIYIGPGGSKDIIVPPESYGFVYLRNAKPQACKTMEK